MVAVLKSDNGTPDNTSDDQEIVRDDTYTVAKKMETLLARHKMRDVIKIRQGTQIISNNLNFNLMYEALK